MEITIGVFLHENTARGSEGGIGHDKERFGVVREGQYRLFQEGFLDLLKGHLMVDGPLPLGIFVHEEQEGFGKIGESGYELPIEVAESNEELDCFYVNRGSPVLDGFEFHQVHFDGAGRDEEAKIFNFGGVKGTLRELQG